MSADVQKFLKDLRTVTLSDPTGVTTEKDLSMAIAVHTKSVKRINYKYK